MRISTLGVLVGFVVSLTGSGAWAQAGPPPPQSIPGKALYDGGRMRTEFDKRRAGSVLATAPRPSGNPLQVRAAANLAGALHVPCEVVDAAELKSGRVKAADGAMVPVVSYEIACKNDLGWIITRQGESQTQTLDCLALDHAAKQAGKAWPKGFICLLEANGAPTVGLQTIAAKVAPTCVVTDGDFVGSGGQPPINRYELACKDGAGFLVDVPAPGSTAPPQAIACAQAADLGARCALPGVAKP